MSVKCHHQYHYHLLNTYYVPHSALREMFHLASEQPYFTDEVTQSSPRATALNHHALLPLGLRLEPEQ